MSSEPLIKVQGLSKVFPIYDKPHYRLMQMLLGGDKRWYREFNALRDISFDIRRGETVGIVGRNGSGKSTLLQVICGTLAPSTGDVHVSGRVAALLELGAGFNPEFTGRENVYLNGTVLGLSRAEIDSRLAEILEFAAIGEFIDRPVKTYSSGMYVRLAFAVAIHVEPDLLVVDEALSVGDEAFQRKCFARIERLRQSGCTVLFVSHAAATVIELCDRAILLDNGELLADGAPKAVISRYQRMLYAPPERVEELRDQMLRERSSDGQEPVSGKSDARGGAILDLTATELTRDVEDYYDESMRSQSELAYPGQGGRIEDPHLENKRGMRVNVVSAGERYSYIYKVHFERSVTAVRFAMLIKSLTGVELAGAVSAVHDQAIEWVEAGTSYTVCFEFDCQLAPGSYFMNAGVLGRIDKDEIYLDRRIDALMFRVVASTGRLTTGLVDLIGKIELVRHEKSAELHV